MNGPRGVLKEIDLSIKAQCPISAVADQFNGDETKLCCSPGENHCVLIGETSPHCIQTFTGKARILSTTTPVARQSSSL